MQSQLLILSAILMSRACGVPVDDEPPPAYLDSAAGDVGGAEPESGPEGMLEWTLEDEDCDGGDCPDTRPCDDE